MPPGTDPSLPNIDEPGNCWQILPQLKPAILCHRFYACLQLATLYACLRLSPPERHPTPREKQVSGQVCALQRGSSDLESTKLDFLFSAQLLQTDILFELNSIPLPMPLPPETIKFPCLYLMHFPVYILCKICSSIPLQPHFPKPYSSYSGELRALRTLSF